MSIAAAIGAGALAAGALSGAADTFGGITSARSYKYQRKLQKHEQQFIEKMSNTAHQREVADLQSAGLNPVLSAGGSGAATLSGGGGSVDAGPNGVDLMNAINSAQQTKAQTDYIKEWQPKIAQSEIEKNEADAKKAEADASLTQQTEKINEPDEETSKALKWWNSTWAGKGINVAGSIMNKLSPFTSPAVNYVSAKKVANAINDKPKNETTTHYNSKGRLTGYTTKTKH